MSTPADAVRNSVSPSAFGDDLRRFSDLTLTLATTDFKLRYFGSALGYLWSLIRPLLFFGVLYLVFTQVFKLGNSIPHYPVYLLTSIMLWTFFLETTTGSVQCLLMREGLLRKMRFPRLVIPLSVALTAMFNLGMNFIVVLVFALATGVEPRLTWLELPLLIVLFAILATGTGMLLSVLYVRFRDIQPIWDVSAQVLFYCSPIIYTVAKYPANLLRPAMANPIAAILTQMHQAFVDPRARTAAAEIGGAVRLLIPLGLIFGIFVIGLWFFTREAPRIAENL
ncbi:MAG: ABC transporter permease [Solirubrobacteraceae bacterium]